MAPSSRPSEPDSASKTEWARQSCRAWGGRLARHRRHSHRFRAPEPGMTAAPKTAVCRANGDLTPSAAHGGHVLSASGKGRTAAVPCCVGIAVCLSPPGTGGVARRRRDGVGPSPFHRFRAPEPGMTAAPKTAVCLSPPIPACGGSTGGVAPRSGGGVGSSRRVNGDLSPRCANRRIRVLPGCPRRPRASRAATAPARR